MRVSSAWAGWLLVTYGAGILLIGLVGVVVWGGGVAFVALAVPPAAAGYGVIRRIRWARALGVAVAGGYALVCAYVATTALRGLTPAPDQPAAGLDPVWTAAAAAFVAAAILVGTSKPDHRPADRRRG
jgi:hypothetical protein